MFAAFTLYSNCKAAQIYGLYIIFIFLSQILVLIPSRSLLVTSHDNSLLFGIL